MFLRNTFGVMLTEDMVLLALYPKIELRLICECERFCVFVYVCVREREREKERGGKRGGEARTFLSPIAYRKQKSAETRWS